MELTLQSYYGIPVFGLPQCGPGPERVSGSTLLKSRALWLFPAFHPMGLASYEDLQKVYAEEPLTLGPGVAEQVELLRRTPQKIADREIPGDFRFQREPYDHQLEALVHALYMPRFGLFAECGMGKTKVAIDMMEVLHREQPDLRWLVCVSKAGLWVWEKELEIHGQGDLGCVTIDGTRAKKEKLLAWAGENRDRWLFLVITYDTAKRLELVLSKLGCCGLIADESHRLRRGVSDTHGTAARLANFCGRRLLMTGTPSLGDPRHIYAQFEILAPFVFTRNRRKFDQTHCVRSPYNDKVVVGYRRMEEVNRRIGPFIRNYSKDQCLDLPERQVFIRTIPATPKIAQAYNMLLTEDYLKPKEGQLVAPGNPAIVVTKLMQLLSGFVYTTPEQSPCDGCCHLHECVELEVKPWTRRCRVHQGPAPTSVAWIDESAKVVVIESLLEEMLSREDAKVIIWTTFRPEIEIMASLLKKMGLGYVAVDGGVSPQRVNQYEEAFNTDRETRVWLANVGTGESRTLNAANYMIYMSLTFRLDHYLQSLDRNLRIGQTRKTAVYRLVTEGSVEESVVHALDRKIDISDSLIANCLLCARHPPCFAQGVRPFEEGCQYQDSVDRVIASPRYLPLLR